MIMQNQVDTTLLRVFGNSYFESPAYLKDIYFQNTLGVLRTYNVKDFGAVGDGTTDDSTAIQAAHDSIVDGGIPSVLSFSPGTYKLDSGLSINTSYMIIEGNNAVLDFSSLSSGTALTLSGDSTQAYQGNPFYNTDKHISHLDIRGPGNTSSVTGIEMSPSGNSTAVAHYSFYNLNVSEFGTGINIGNNSYILGFYGCEFWICGTCVQHSAGLSNSGERIIFTNCSFYNSDTGFDIGNSACDISLYGCSVDGMHDNYIYCNGGMISCSGCHFEGNFAPDYGDARVLWVPASSDTVYANFKDCLFIIKGDRNNALFDLDDTTYLNLNDCNLTLDTAAGVGIVINTGSGGGFNAHGTIVNASDTFLTTSANYWNNNFSDDTIRTNKMFNVGNSVIVGTAALATDATDGFLYIPTCAGTPTGTPTTKTGTAPIVWDSTNNKLYVYDGGWIGGTNPGAFT